MVPVSFTDAGKPTLFNHSICDKNGVSWGDGGENFMGRRDGRDNRRDDGI